MLKNWKIVKIEDLMRESDFWARKAKAKLVDKKHVITALKEKVYRSNMVEKKIQENSQGKQKLNLFTIGKNQGKKNQGKKNQAKKKGGKGKAGAKKR